MCKILFSLPKVLLTYQLNFLRRVKARIDYTLEDTSIEQITDTLVSEHIITREESYDRFISDLKNQTEGLYDIPHEEVDDELKKKHVVEIAE